MLITCVYSSAAAEGLSQEGLTQILAEARENNAQQQISGMLLYDEGSFFQVLEGEEAQVEQLFELISQDPRHRQLVKLVQQPIETRSFSDWSMGIARLSRDELRSIPGLNDFFLGGQSFRELDEGRAKQLLAAFKQGRWRQAIQ